MVSRWSISMGRVAPKPSPPSDSDLSSASEGGLTSREANDRRLRQAISYLTYEGGDDETGLYVDRIRSIRDCIIKQYREEGYSFDPVLYGRLRSSVQEVQTDNKRIEEESSSVDLEDSDDSVEELLSPQVLYRKDEDFESYPPVRPRGPRAPSIASQSWGKPRQADIIELQHRYGGPNGEFEEWHKDFPAELPFGETLYMQEWESMKINHDLAESAKKSRRGGDPIVTTNVPYDAVEASGRFKHEDVYDSGSRFKLPGIVQSVWDNISQVAGNLPFASVAETFDKGGEESYQRAKDYAPRIVLRKTNPNAEQDSGARPKGIGKPLFTPTSSAQVLGKRPVGTSHFPPARATPSAKRAKTNKIGTIDPERLLQVRQRSQKEYKSPLEDGDFDVAGPSDRAPKSSASTSRSKSTTPVSALTKRLEARRQTAAKAATRRSAVASPPNASTTYAAASTERPKPVARRLSHIISGPSEKGSAARAPKSLTTTPVSSRPAIRTATPVGKGNLSKANDSNTKTSKKSVAFAGKSPASKTNVSSEPKVMPKSAIKKPAAKRTKKATSSVPDVTAKLGRSAGGVSSVKRGTLRSGASFKA